MGTIKLANKRVYIFPVENPANENTPLLFVPHNYLVQEIRALKIGGTGSFDWELRFSLNANDQGAGTLLHYDTGVNNDTTGVIYTAPFNEDPPIVPSGNWLWLELSSIFTGLGAHIQLTGEES